jgi:ABC-type phosphate transport system permease subunit
MRFLGRERRKKLSELVSRLTIVPMVTTVIEQLSGAREHNVANIAIGLGAAFVGIVLAVLILPND